MPDDDDDDDGLPFGLFGDDGDDGHDGKTEPARVAAVPEIKPPAGCPVDNPKGMLVQARASSDGDKLFGAKIIQFDAATYSIMWLESGIMRYRVAPADIAWEPPPATRPQTTAQAQPVTVDPTEELWLAARRGSLATVRELVRSGVPYDATGSTQQRTPFYHAVFAGHKDVVLFLLELGARDDDGTAFIVANSEIRDVLTGYGLSKSGARRPSRANSMRRASRAAPPALESLPLSQAQLQALASIEARIKAAETALAAMKAVAPAPAADAAAAAAAAAAKSRAEPLARVSSTAALARSRGPLGKLWGALTCLLPRRRVKVAKKTAI